MQKIELRGSGNFTNSDPVDDGRCPVCHGMGYEVVDVLEPLYGEGKTARYAVPCSRCNGGHADKAGRAKSIANIPQDRKLSDFDWTVYGEDLTRQRKIVNTFVSQFQNMESDGFGLFITSKIRGSGKTFLASCIGGELADRYAASIRFVSASDLLDIAKQNDNGRDPLLDLINCRVLILDDLGQKLTGRDWLTDVLFRIIDKRYSAHRIMIVTSNVPLAELDFDDRLVDRLNAMTIQIKLPEFCVRARAANTRKIEMLKKYGIA